MLSADLKSEKNSEYFYALVDIKHSFYDISALFLNFAAERAENREKIANMVKIVPLYCTVYKNREITGKLRNSPTYINHPLFFPRIETSADVHLKLAQNYLNCMSRKWL